MAPLVSGQTVHVRAGPGSSGTRGLLTACAGGVGDATTRPLKVNTPAVTVQSVPP